MSGATRSRKGGASPVGLVADPTGVIDAQPALTAAINALPAAGGTITVPRGTYRLATGTPVPTKPIIIQGAGTGVGTGLEPTVFKADAGVTAFTFKNGAATGARSGLRNLVVSGSDVAAGPNAGVLMQANSAWLENVVVRGFGGDGVLIASGTAGPVVSGGAGSVTPSASGGTLPPETVYIKVAGVDTQGLETLTSTEMSAVIPAGGAGSALIAWSPPPGAQQAPMASYKVYIGTAPGGQTGYLTTAGATTLIYTGQALTAGTPFAQATINANCCHAAKVYCYSNKRDGFHVEGNDSNVGQFDKISAVANGRHGIYDESYLGCVWIAPHCSGNLSGVDYRLGGASRHSRAVGAYWETNPAGSALQLDFGCLGAEWEFATATGGLPTIKDNSGAANIVRWGEKNGAADISHSSRFAMGDQTGTDVLMQSSTGANAAQTISATPDAGGGPVAFTWGGQTTAPIAWPPTAAQVQAALQALSSIGAGNIVCWGGPLPGRVVCQFQGTLGYAAQATITVATQPATGAVSVVNSQTGSGPVKTASFTRGTLVSQSNTGATPAPTTVATWTDTITAAGIRQHGATAAVREQLLNLVQLSGGVAMVRRAIADADTTLVAPGVGGQNSPGDTYVPYTSLTAARVATLPALSTVQAGTLIVVADESGACSASNTITVAGAGANHIDAAATYVLNAAYGYVVLIAGSGVWKIIGTPAVAGGGGAPGLRTAFGDGSDGALVYDGAATIAAAAPAASVYTLVRDVYATTVVVNSGVTIKANGFRIFATTSVTVSAGGTISADGVAGAANGTAGTNAFTGVHSSAGTPGAGATGAGVAGGATSTFGLGPSGAGGLGPSGAGGTGGSPSKFLTGLAMPFHDLALMRSAVVYLNGTARLVASAAGGGGGGGDGTNKGGGGGGAAGLIVLAAPVITNSGTISAAGAAGGTPTTGNAGGGGGGAGGGVVTYTLAGGYTAGTIVVTGGAAGTGVGTGAAGVAGTAGFSLNVTLV